MRKQYGILEGLEMIDIADEGKAVAKYGELVVFVSGAIPGDVADVKITRSKRNFLEGKAVNFQKFSIDRTEPFCSHFGICGGCKWQYLSYEKQLYYKQKQAKDCIERIAKIDSENILLPIKPSEKTRYYRNKLEYTFSCYRWLTDEDMQLPSDGRDMNALGFHIPGKFDKVLDIGCCYLQEEPTNAIRNGLKEFALKNNLSFFDLRKQQGFLRNIIVRSTSTKELMVIVSFFYDDEDRRELVMDYLADNFPMITSLMYVINSKCNDTISDLEIKCYSGNTFITELMGDLKFKIGPVSFFQTNSQQAFELYRVVSDFASLTGTEVVYDLYTGTGTIANFIAGSAKKVVGIEYIKSAIDDAFENSKINGISNTIFYDGDIAKILNAAFVEKNEKPDVVITDPPRNGMHKDVVAQLLEILPEKIVYVSCNPSTQARDIELLAEKYSLIKSQPVDMFPHTQHVENVVLLIRS